MGCAAAGLGAAVGEITGFDTAGFGVAGRGCPCGTDVVRLALDKSSASLGFVVAGRPVFAVGVEEEPGFFASTK
jgi:hypothetical protein